MRRAKSTLLEGADQRPHQLYTDEERAALRRLKPSWGTRDHHKPFREAVLARLALIDAVRKNEETRRNTDEQPPRDARVVEQFQRRAKKVRNFVQSMQEPMPETLATAVARRVRSWPPPIGWSSFPASELMRHAEACDRAARFFSGQSRHGADPLSGHIVKLLNFVRLHTREAHLKELATLLKRPCADVGMNVNRLDQLLRDHAARYPEVCREAERAKAGFAALLVEQFLTTPSTP